MAALRKYSLMRWSWYGLTQSLTFSRRTLPLLAMIPVSLLLALVGLVGRFEADIVTAGFHSFVPYTYVYYGGLAIGALAGFSILYGLCRAIPYMQKGGGEVSRRFNSITSSLSVLFSEVALQRVLFKCGKDRILWMSHMMVVWGFLASAVTTSALFIFRLETPLALSHPVKILGNIGAFLLVAGGAILIVRRKTTEGLNSAAFDWSFLILLFIVGLTGLLTEVSRIVNIAFAAYPTYLAHLTTAALLLVLAPFTKFAHAVYRPLALLVARMKGWTL